MPLTTAGREAAATGVTAAGAWVSLHTADPSTTGANEATGGSPAYARKQTTWTPGSVDGVVTGSEVTIDSGAATYTHVGIWTAATGGTFLGSVAISSVVLSGQSQVKVTPTYTQNA